MNEKAYWIELVTEMMLSSTDQSHYGDTKHLAAANYYRTLLGLPLLKSHDESMVFIDELFRIPIQELLTIPTLICDNIKVSSYDN